MTTTQAMNQVQALQELRSVNKKIKDCVDLAAVTTAMKRDYAAGANISLQKIAGNEKKLSALPGLTARRAQLEAICGLRNTSVTKQNDSKIQSETPTIGGARQNILRALIPGKLYTVNEIQGLVGGTGTYNLLTKMIESGQLKSKMGADRKKLIYHGELLSDRLAAEVAQQNKDFNTFGQPKIQEKRVASVSSSTSIDKSPSLVILNSTKPLVVDVVQPQVKKADINSPTSMTRFGWLKPGRQYSYLEAKIALERELGHEVSSQKIGGELGLGIKLGHVVKIGGIPRSSLGAQYAIATKAKDPRFSWLDPNANYTLGDLKTGFLLNMSGKTEAQIRGLVGHGVKMGWITKKVVGKESIFSLSA